jgi:hypothetical protein
MSPVPSGVSTEDLCRELSDRLRAFGLHNEAFWVDRVLTGWCERYGHRDKVKQRGEEVQRSDHDTEGD